MRDTLRERFHMALFHLFLMLHPHPHQHTLRVINTDHHPFESNYHWDLPR